MCYLHIFPIGVVTLLIHHNLLYRDLENYNNSRIKLAFHAHLFLENENAQLLTIYYVYFFT